MFQDKLMVILIIVRRQSEPDVALISLKRLLLYRKWFDYQKQIELELKTKYEQTLVVITKVDEGRFTNSRFFIIIVWTNILFYVRC